MVLELEATNAQVQRILQSKTFRTSEVHRNLLTYLADKSMAGDTESLKEYTVGLDVFGKPASYDPRQESTVRMHVARLRQKLAEYYRTEGVDDPILVDLPKGGFRVTFESRATPEVAVPAAVEQPVPPPARSYKLEIALGAALLIAVLVAAYFGVRLATVKKAAGPITAALTPELQELWGPMLNSSRPIMLCLDTPSAKFPGVGAASGAFLLGQFLHQQNVLLTPSNQLSAPEIAMGNVVFLGPGTNNRQIQALPVERQLTLEPDGVRVLNPAPGEQEFYKDHEPQDLQDVEESYALISHVPGLYGSGEILYIAGNHVGSIMGGVQALTEPDSAKVLVSKIKDAQGKLPRYYQLLLKVRAMDDMPIDSSYVLHRELAQSK